MSDNTIGRIVAIICISLIILTAIVCATIAEVIG